MISQNGFNVIRAGEIKEVPEKKWHIESLWGYESVGIIGGEPKCCKSWLALEMALSIATKTPCLGLFAINRPGLCLAYFAEDSKQNTLLRFQNLCQSKRLDPATVPLLLIDAPVLRLDEEKDRQKLETTVAKYKPALLVLDPLVRLHSLDENSAREMAGLLSFIRGLQRKYNLAIILTHHSSKKRRSRPGQALRGSSDLHAFGDTNLYLSKAKEGIRLQIEHRDAPSDETPLFMKLMGADKKEPVHLKIVTSENAQRLPTSKTESEKNTPDGVQAGILAVISKNKLPIKGSEIRRELALRKSTVFSNIRELEQKGRITKTSDGWCLT